MKNTEKSDIPAEIDEVEIEPTDAPVVVEHKRKSRPAPVVEPYAVVGKGDRDDVPLSAIKYKNMFAKKSLAVHHVQRRLNELGYTDAYADRDGYYGDLTLGAVAAFQTDKKLAETTGIMDRETLDLLFKGDPNVRVI